MNGHTNNELSDPTHFMWSLHIGPDPWPSAAVVLAEEAPVKPSCLHATFFINYIPCIIANCSPYPTVKHFKATIARPTIRQTNLKRVIWPSYIDIWTMSAVFMVTPTTVSTTGDWWLISKAIHRIYSILNRFFAHDWPIYTRDLIAKNILSSL